MASAIDGMMSRENLMESLRLYGDRFVEEGDVVERFITFVAEHEACFERTLAVGHVTGSAWVVNQRGDRVLLTHHKKLNRWFQLGGHADGEADVLAVAMQEVAEESGLGDVLPLTEAIFDVDIHRIPARGEEAEHYHYDVRYAMQAQGSEEYVVSEESHDLAWVEIATIAELTDEESMLRMARKWRARW